MGRDQCLRAQPVTVSGNPVLFFSQIMMNAVTKVITAMRMHHVLIPLDTLNAYVTQGLLETGISVQVILPFFSLLCCCCSWFFFVCYFVMFCLKKLRRLNSIYSFRMYLSFLFFFVIFRE